MRKITVESGRWPEKTIAIHPSTVMELNMGMTTTLVFGVRKMNATIRLTDTVKEWTLSLSEDVREGLLIPLATHYEWKFTGDELELGPFIAFYAGTEQKHVLRRMKVLGKYTEHYSKINGILFCFCADGVEMESRTINGYIFDPVENKWVVEKCGYPAAIFRNVSMTEDFRQDFIEQAGKKIMNEKVIGKWEMHQLLSKSKELCEFLPKTTLCQSPMDILRFLKTFSIVYVKPVNGYKGSGIVKIKREGKKFLLSYKFKKKLVEKLITAKRVAAFFEKRFKKVTFLVQQGLDIHHSGKLVDFRAMVVKDENERWNAMGLVGKSVESNGITSNMATGGIVRDSVKVLETLVGLTTDDAAIVDEKMKAISLKIGEVLDTSGYHFANLGVDISIDRDEKIWIIEVNHRAPLHALMKKAGNNEQYKRILRTNMLYAKNLAGF